MTVRIARLRSGEDIIAEIKEVVLKDTQQVAAIQLEDPYCVALVEDPNAMFSEGQPIKVSNPKVHMLSWVPLSASRTIHLDPNEIICVYDPHSQVLKQYSELLEAVNGGGNNLGGGAEDESLTFENSFVEPTGSVPDWEGD
jgi:hypothetical protein